MEFAFACIIALHLTQQEQEYPKRRASEPVEPIYEVPRPQKVQLGLKILFIANSLA